MSTETKFFRYYSTRKDIVTPGDIKITFESLGNTSNGQKLAGKFRACDQLNVILLDKGIPNLYVAWFIFLHEYRHYMQYKMKWSFFENYRKCKCCYYKSEIDADAWAIEMFDRFFAKDFPKSKKYISRINSKVNVYKSYFSTLACASN